MKLHERPAAKNGLRLIQSRPMRKTQLAPKDRLLYALIVVSMGLMVLASVVLALAIVFLGVFLATGIGRMIRELFG